MNYKLILASGLLLFATSVGATQDTWSKDMQASPGQTRPNGTILDDPSAQKTVSNTVLTPAQSLVGARRTAATMTGSTSNWKVIQIQPLGRSRSDTRGLPVPRGPG